MAIVAQKRRFTVSEYDKMLAAGILSEDDRVELIEGDIIRVAPKGSRHAACVTKLVQTFIMALQDRCVVRVQDPIQLDDHSEPEPDLVLARTRPDHYATAHPTPEDLLLVIEVADSSLLYDQAIKKPLYARSGIAELWLVDLTQQRIVVHRHPTAEGYESVQHAHAGDTLSPAAFPDVALAVDAILP